MWDRFLESIPTVAQSPLAVFLYVCLLGTYAFIAVKKHRLDKISKSLRLVPEKQRADLIAKEYLTLPRSGVSADQWLRSRRQVFYFWAFLATLVTLILLAMLTYKVSGEEARAEVGLRFAYPEEPSLIVVNPSEWLVKDAKWMVALWNVDLPERNDPLPIPVGIFDWIKPHDEGGPQLLFDTPLVKPLLKPGDHLLGTACVSCPLCAKGHTYILDVVWGKGGTFSEIANDTSGKTRLPVNFTRPYREAYFRALESIPTTGKIQIASR